MLITKRLTSQTPQVVIGGSARKGGAVIFLRLMEQQQGATEWTATQRKWIEWVATPSDLRDPHSMSEFCKRYRVERTTLWRWKRKPEFHQEVQKIASQFLGSTLPEVMESFKHQAVKGSLGHQKLLFEMIGMYVPKIAPTDPKGENEYSGGDYKERLLAAIERLAGAGPTESPGEPE